MTDPYTRPPHYQRHYQSMVLNLCSIYPYFETDNFDRAYNAELTFATSKYPETGLDFCYYWTEKVMWEKFGLSGAYGEFPGRYGGPEYIVQQQIGVNALPPTPQSAQPAPGIAPNFFEETPNTPSRADTQSAQSPLGQAPGVSEAQATPASQCVQQRVDLEMQSAPHLDQPPQDLARNLFEGYLRSQDPRISDLPASLSAQDPQDLATGLLKPESSPTPQAVEQSSGLAAELDPQSPTPSSLLTARLAFPDSSDPISASMVASSAAPLIPLPPLLLSDSRVKDPTTGEVITVKMYERRCLSRGAEIAIHHAKAAVSSETARLSKARVAALLDKSLTTALTSIIQEHTQ
ncbi:hypothetical protein NHQ30_004753 [Ciborinia camelliae]|nr:hypothetical protein NHQ30_004753 [Ciborinia camelliae]